MSTRHRFIGAALTALLGIAGSAEAQSWGGGYGGGYGGYGYRGGYGGAGPFAFTYGYGYPFGVGRYGTSPLFAGYSGVPRYPVNRVFYGIGSYGTGLFTDYGSPVWGPRYGLFGGFYPSDIFPGLPPEPADEFDPLDIAELPPVAPTEWAEAAASIPSPTAAPPAFAVPAIGIPNLPPPGSFAPPAFPTP